MSFRQLFADTETEDKPAPKLHRIQPATNGTKKQKIELKRGCAHCTLNEVEGIQKIKGTIMGKEMLLIAQSPGAEENKQGVELVGPAGQFLWDEMRAVGLRRRDFDIFNAIKCFPADAEKGSYNTFLRMRNPTKEEIHCCSLYSDRNLEKSNAKQIVLVGQIAAKAILKTKNLPSQKTFWSEELNARIYILDHPAFFIRGYGQGQKLTAFRAQLARIAEDRKTISKNGQVKEANLSDQYAYIRSQDYRLVLTKKDALEAEKVIRSYAGKGRRTAVDIESDEFDGVQRVFATGFCPKPGLSFVFVFIHRDQKREDGKQVFEIAKRLLEDETVSKTLHYGCSDARSLEGYEKVELRGFTHDSNLSEYLRFSDRRQYGLDAIAEQRFTHFSGYGMIVTQDLMAVALAEWKAANPDKEKIPKIYRSDISKQYNYIFSSKLIHYKHLTLDNLRLYNGADCDLAKRIEVDNKKHVPQALMQLYIDLSFLLYDMGNNGPEFDYEQCEKLGELYPAQAAKLKKWLCSKLGDNKYNPGSPQQVQAALYKKLKLEFPFDNMKPNTRKPTLLMLGRKHEFPRVQLQWRKVARAVSTLKSYKFCADANGGRLRTKFWATGTRTGRLSSGGEKKKKGSKLINLQNIKKDSRDQNMCVADPRWRRFFLAATEILRPFKKLRFYWRDCDVAKSKKEQAPKATEEIAQEFKRAAKLLEDWVRKHLPDLRAYLILDFGQHEVRVMAQLAKCKNLIADCMEEDIHSTVGAAMTGWDKDRIRNDEETRTLTKNVHFGIMFGISKGNLFRFVQAMSPPDMRDRISEEQVNEAYDRYFERYPEIREYIEKQREFARENGYVTTAFGMVQTLNITADIGEEDSLEELDEDEEGTQKRGAWWGNQAINGPVQGTAHQVLICALVNIIRKAAEYLALLGIPVMEVHDSLTFRVPVLQILEADTKAKYLLEKESLATIASDFPAIKWKVPIVVETKAGIRLGCKVKVSEKSGVGGFLLDWYRECKKQEDALDKEMESLLA